MGIHCSRVVTTQPQSTTIPTFNAGSSSHDCVKGFFDTYEAQGYEMNATDLRALFGTCLSCYPLWAGNGLGWSAWASPYDCSSQDEQAEGGVLRYAGAELMVYTGLPVRFDESGRRDFSMPTLESDVLLDLYLNESGDFSYIQNGFC